VISGFASIFAYNQQIKKFWHEISDDWQEHERMLTRDPRNKWPGVRSVRARPEVTFKRQDFFREKMASIEPE